MYGKIGKNWKVLGKKGEIEKYDEIERKLKSVVKYGVVQKVWWNRRGNWKVNKLLVIILVF